MYGQYLSGVLSFSLSSSSILLLWEGNALSWPTGRNRYKISLKRRRKKWQWRFLFYGERNYHFFVLFLRTHFVWVGTTEWEFFLFILSNGGLTDALRMLMRSTCDIEVGTNVYFPFLGPKRGPLLPSSCVDPTISTAMRWSARFMMPCVLLNEYLSPRLWLWEEVPSKWPSPSTWITLPHHWYCTHNFAFHWLFFLPIFFLCRALVNS